jgi:hypothetical protein
MPGLQALFAFQLIAVFNQRFSLLLPAFQTLHVVSLLLTAIAAMFTLSVAAFHRIAEPHKITLAFVNRGGVLVTLGMVCLSVAISLDIMVVGSLVYSAAAALALGLPVLCLYMLLWVAYPVGHRMRHHGKLTRVSGWAARARALWARAAQGRCGRAAARACSCCCCRTRRGRRRAEDAAAGAPGDKAHSGSRASGAAGALGDGPGARGGGGAADVDMRSRSTRGALPVAGHEDDAAGGRPGARGSGAPTNPQPGAPAGGRERDAPSGLPLDAAL